MYSSTTKNWFHTHPLLTRSSDEGPSSCLLELKLLVLGAAHQPKLQQLRRPIDASNVQAPAIQKGAILIKKKKESKKENSALVYM